MEKTVPSLTNDINQINKTITKTMPELELHLSGISQDVTTISNSTNSMANSTRSMGQSTWEINRSISKPLRLMNNIIPWDIETPPPPMYRSY